MTWLLLRGLMREKAHWGAFPEQLRRAFPGSTVHVLDFPGNGERHLERSFLSIAESAEFLQNETAHLPSPFGVIAISMGGMIAHEWLKRYPERASRLVLINSSLRAYSPLWQRLQPRNYPTLLKLIGVRNLLERERQILRMTTHDLNDENAVVEAWAAIARSRPVSKLNALRQLWAAALYKPERLKPPCPTLILASREDALVSATCSQALAEDWQMPIYFHPRAGHDLPLQDPNWVCEQIRQWQP